MAHLLGEIWGLNGQLVIHLGLGNLLGILCKVGNQLGPYLGIQEGLLLEMLLLGCLGLGCWLG